MRHSTKKIISVILSLALLASACVIPMGLTVSAEKAPIKILAIGNSYSNNSTELISKIAESMGLDVTAASLYQAGCPLRRHVAYYEAYENLGHDAYYASTNSNKYEYLTVNGVANKNIQSMQEAIAYTDWDYITIQQMPDGCDDITTYWTEENPYLTKVWDYVQTELAKSGNTKCEVLIHQGWSFSHAMSIDNAYNYYPVDYENTKDFFAKIEETVNEAAEIIKNHADLDAAPELVLSGKAVQLAKDEFGFADTWGDVNSIYADSISHLGYVGRYLIGCVWIETFAAKAGLDVDTRTATYVPTDKGVTEEMAVLLRSCAHEAVTGESDTIYGDWRAVPYGEGLKITHYVGEVPETGSVTIPAVLNETPVVAVGATTFKYVEGVDTVILESNGVFIENGAIEGMDKIESFWDGTSVKPEGKGTEEEPYLISNAAELHYAIGTMTGTSYKDSIFKLTNDIYINDIAVDTANGTVIGADTARQWFPDGNGSNPFCGILDGDNHVIYGLYINKAYTGTNTDWTVGRGLIPYGACTVKNLGIEKSYVKAEKTAVSAFVGTNNNHSYPIYFENCYIGEDVYLYGSCVGGFFAGGTGINSVTGGGFKNCYSLATIYATGDGTNTFYGQLTGQVWSCESVVAENCYTVGRIFGQGGLKMTNCFTSESKYNVNGLTILTANDMKGDASAVKMAKLYEAFVVNNSGYPILRSFSSRTNGEWSGFRLSVMKGSGTEADPWLVANAENLAHIAFGNTASGKFYKLTTDVYLNDIEKIDFSNGSVAEGYDAMAWENDKNFFGTFDGNGHVVYGMWYPVGNAAGSTSIIAAGLFGNPKAGATIKNVGVRYAYLESVGQVGAIAGFVESVKPANVLIDSCFSDSTVTVVSKKSAKIINDVTSSGILGGLINSTNITISNCYSTAVLRSENCQRKILASVWQSGATGNENVRIENCWADGEICGGNGASNKVNVVVNSYCPANNNANYLTWDKIAATAMTGAKALDRMPKLGDKFVAQVKDYPTLKIFADDTAAPDKSFWDGSFVPPTKGSGTAADPYLIETPEEFAYIVYSGGSATAYYKLTKDVYLNRVDKVDWATGQLLDENYPVNEWFSSNDTGGDAYDNGTGTEITFSGNVDGDGHTVYGVYYELGQPGTNSGLFPAVKKATIKNLAIKSSFYSAGRWVSALVGSLTGRGDLLTVENVLVDSSVKIVSYNSGNYHYNGVTKSDRINAASPFSGTLAGQVYFESNASGGIIAFLSTGATLNAKNCAVYAKFDGAMAKVEYSNPFANGGKPYAVKNSGTIYGIMGTCWNPQATNIDNCVTTTNPVNNGNGALGKPNFTMFNVYNLGSASTRDGVINLTADSMKGANALSNTALDGSVWYAVKAEGAYPSLRVIGTTICDVDEDGTYNFVSDSAALREVILNKTANSNGDVNKSGAANICDLVKLHLK